jgi:hypothetical protein
LEILSTTSALAPVIACHQLIWVAAKADVVENKVNVAATPAAKPWNLISLSRFVIGETGSPGEYRCIVTVAQ